MSWTKVLIVDDEVEFAAALSERLLLRDYDTKAVYNVDDAIAAIKQDPPEVLLLDLKMPGMSGIELYRTIKEFHPSIEVIFVTGQACQDGDETIPRGAFDCVMKPVDIDELTKKIDKAKQGRIKK